MTRTSREYKLVLTTTIPLRFIKTIDKMALQYNVQLSYSKIISEALGEYFDRRNIEVINDECKPCYI